MNTEVLLFYCVCPLTSAWLKSKIKQGVFFFSWKASLRCHLFFIKMLFRWNQCWKNVMRSAAAYFKIMVKDLRIILNWLQATPKQFILNFFSLFPFFCLPYRQTHAYVTIYSSHWFSTAFHCAALTSVCSLGSSPHVQQESFSAEIKT